MSIYDGADDVNVHAGKGSFDDWHWCQVGHGRLDVEEQYAYKLCRTSHTAWFQTALPASKIQRECGQSSEISLGALRGVPRVRV